MNRRGIRRRGIATIVVAFVVTSLIGLWLASGLGRAQMTLADIGLRGVLGFMGVAPLYLLGTYWYVQGSREIPETGVTEMEIQRDLIDLIRRRRQLSFAEAATELDVKVDDIQAQVEALIALDIFMGRVDWDTQTLYAEESVMLSD